MIFVLKEHFNCYLFQTDGLSQQHGTIMHLYNMVHLFYIFDIFGQCKPFHISVEHCTSDKNSLRTLNNTRTIHYWVKPTLLPNVVDFRKKVKVTVQLFM